MLLWILCFLLYIPLIAIIVFICNLFRYIIAKITVYSNDIENRRKAMAISGITAAVLTGITVGIAVLLDHSISFM